jgi:hypothetical protein
VPEHAVEAIAERWLMMGFLHPIGWLWSAGEEREAMERREEQEYALTLEMLLRVLNAHRQTCEVRAEVSAAIIAAAEGKSGRGKAHAVYVVELLVEQGQVRSCLVRHRQSGGVLVEGAKALSLSQQCGELFWRVRPRSQFTSPLLRPGLEGSHGGAVLVQRSAQQDRFQRSPPRWVRQIEREQFAALPYKLRQVLLLVDGRRGVAELNRILPSYSPDQLVTLLGQLEAWGLITFADPNDGISTGR